MLLFHCQRYEARDLVRREGLPLTRHGFVFAWPNIEAAHEYREKLFGGWCDVWAFDDCGESTENPGGLMSAGQVSRVMARPISPDELQLVHKAQ